MSKVQKNHLLILTSGFPYGTGETFLEEELLHLDQSRFEITIFPIGPVSGMESRLITEDINVSVEISQKSPFRAFIIGMLYSLTLKIFWKELFKNFFKFRYFKSFKSFIGTTYSFVFLFRKLRLVLRKYKNQNVILYSYWFDIGFYAATLIEENYENVKVITRAHGFDVNPDRKQNGYFPYKELLAKDKYHYFPISDRGRNIIFNINHSKNIEVFRLGTRETNHDSRSRVKDIITILSCSSCIQIKRIELILKNVFALSVKYPEKKFVWKHVGDGELFSNLVNLAEKTFSNQKNIKYEFVGQVPNDLVHGIYKENEISIFINLSESEGIPVSIMEAISFNVPVLATNVGAVSEIVTNETGRLLEKNFDFKDFDKNFWEVINLESKPIEFWNTHYNATSNYGSFNKKLIQLFDSQFGNSDNRI